MNAFRQLHQPTSRTIEVDQKQYLFFGGTAYLGLLVNRDYQDLVIEGIDKYGLNNGTSRSNNVQLGIYDDAEALMAQRFGYADAALFSSGYLAAQATVRSLVADKVYYAPHTHPALWLGDRAPEVLGHDFALWGAKLVEEINASPYETSLIISNAIDNLKPERYDFSFLAGINPSKRVCLILDDSHGLGIVKRYDTSALMPDMSESANIEVILLASLAKGLGTDAGLVLGSNALIERIKKSPIFMGGSPSSPGAIYALTKGEKIYEQAFTALHKNIDFFTRHLPSESGLNCAEGFPVFTSTSPHLYRYLYKNEVIISSFPYPLPHSPLLNRVVISALHSQEDLIRLTEVLHDFG